MKRKAILSTTHVDRHNMKMTRGALAQGAIDSKGPRAISMGVEHDVMFPPAGKLLSAYVEPTQDGEFQLVGTQELIETVGEVIMPDGRVFIRQACPSDARPFKIAEESVEEKTVIYVDPVNFSTQEPEKEFFSHLEDAGEFRPDFLMRKSVIPDPEMVIHAGEAVAYWLGTRKLLNKTTRAIDEDIASFYKLATRGVIEYAKRAIPKNRPRTYVIIVPGTPLSVEFVARTTDPKQVLAAINPSVLKPYVEEAMELNETYAAEKVQFVLQKDGKWAVSFMLTTNGEVIGDQYVIKRRDQVLQRMIESNRRRQG